MIASFPARLAGVGVLLVVAAACRDLPTTQAAPTTPALSTTLDTIDAVPIEPEIYWATTSTAFYDGRYGGQATVRIIADMEYYGNRASHDISYSILGDEPDITGRVYDEQNQTYNPNGRHRFTRAVTIATHKNCGLDITANTTHQAWWHVWLPFAPEWKSSRASRVSKATRLQTDLCRAPEEETPDEGDTGDNGGGGSHGGWVTIETCYYWAHFVNGELVDIELRYCTYDLVPVAEE